MNSIRRLTVPVAALMALTLTASCASTGSRPTRDRDVINRETIQNSPASDVYQLIQSERPFWLRSRGAITAQASDEGIQDFPLVVYIDNTRHGTLQDLVTIPTHGITEVRRLSPREATTRFGTGHPRGAILISTRP